jgi:transglutaminase-like putative cysteine protease
MRSINYLKLLLTTAIAFCSLESYAQRNNFYTVPTEPSWLQKIITTHKRPADRDIRDGYYLSLFEQQNNIETQELYQHIIREIVSDNGIQNASEISITYDPSYQKLTCHKIIIWRNNKPINKMMAADFKVMQNEKELSKFIYSGTFDAYLILDDVRKGDRIEYSFTLKGANPVFLNKYANTYYFDGDSQISNIYYNLIAKQDRQIQFKNFNTVPTLKVKLQNGFKIYEWQDQLTNSIKAYDFEPSWFNAYSRVQVSEFKSWKEIVDWSIELNKYGIGKSGLLPSKIKELQFLSKGNAVRYLELATRFVQDQIRYMGIEMGEYSHRPNSPDKVLKQRYGDCKDKSLLLIQLLKGNSISAYPVYVNTYLKDKTKEILPTTGAFNHAVVLAELNGQKIWIDPTMSDQGGPIQKNYFPYAANVLVVKPGNNQLEWVEPNPQGKLSSITLIKMPDTSAGNKAEVTIRSTYTANYADQMRSEIASSGIDKLEKDFLEYYTKIYPGIGKTKDLIVRDDRKNNLISLEEEYEIENPWVKEDSLSNKYFAYFYGDMVNNELRKLGKARNIPFALKYPSNIHQVVKILFPMDADIKNEDFQVKRPGYSFHYKRSKSADTINLYYDYENTKYEISAAETKQYVKDRAAIADLISYSISWNGGIDDANLSTDINFSMVILGIFTFIIASIGAFFIYRQKAPFDLEEIKSARQIGGWLVLVAIGLVVNPFVLLYTIYKTGALNEATWDNFSSFGSTEVLWKWLLSFEMVENITLVVFSLLVIVLFFNRRKELPKYYIIFRISSIVLITLDIVCAHFLNKSMQADVDLSGDIMEVVKLFILSAIWITYFLKSSRVKETFVFTYPESAWRNEYIKEISSQMNAFPAQSNDVHLQATNSGEKENTTTAEQ